MYAVAAGIASEARSNHRDILKSCLSCIGDFVGVDPRTAILIRFYEFYILVKLLNIILSTMII